MAQTVREVMTSPPITLEPSASLVDAARAMRERDVGAVVIAADDQIQGLVTDRDIVVRAVADARDPATTQVADVISGDLATLSPDDPVGAAVKRMRELSVRRLPVVEQGRPVGIVALGDLAVDRDPDSALADISASEPNT
jgi:CBS domain-containing protein